MATVITSIARGTERRFHDGKIHAGVSLPLCVGFACAGRSHQARCGAGPNQSDRDPHRRSWLDYRQPAFPGLDRRVPSFASSNSSVLPGDWLARRHPAAPSWESSFAATDVPIPDAELALARGQILAFPVALDAIVPIYNLPGNPELRFSESTLAGIFLGKIAEWDDTTIASDNPAAVLPRMDIKVAHHFPSGTVETEIMVDYLSKISAAFRTTLADSSSGANWPVANAMAGFKGPEG